MDFQITEDMTGDGVRIFRVAGDVDFGVAPQLKHQLISRIDGGDRQVVVDLSAAGFVDSTAIGVLVGALKRLHESGGSLAVVCDNENIRSIFETVGLENVITLHRSDEDALADLAHIA